MSSTEKLLKEIEAFLIRTGMKASDFGHQAVGDVAFVYRLRSGKDTRLKTADRVRRFMTDQKASGKSRPKPAASGGRCMTIQIAGAGD